YVVFFFFSSRRRHTRSKRDWSSDVCSSDLHFCMDLEFLLRRKPQWRRIARGILFQPGDISANGESAEAAADGETPDDDSDISLEIGRASCRERVEKGGVGRGKKQTYEA